MSMHVLPMKTHYIVVCELSSSALVRKINELIGLGWEPLGGVAAGSGHGGTLQFAQALIKREPKS